MDDVTRVWTPQRRADGSIEIGVNHNDNRSERLSFESVSLARYIELYRKEALDFQVKGLERPIETRPTPEEVQAVLEQRDRQPTPVRSAGLQAREKRTVSSKMSVSPKPKSEGVTLVVVPHDSILADFVVPPAPKQENVEVPFSNEQIDEMAKRIYGRLSPREKEVANLLLENELPEVAQKLGIELGTAYTYMTTVCNRAGIPKSNKSHPYDRLGAYRQVIRRLKKLTAEGYFNTRNATAETWAKQREAGEVELLSLYRLLDDVDKARVLTFVRLIK